MKMRPVTRGRPGTIIPFLALAIVALLAVVALGIDLGVLTVARTECQNAADAASLAGSRILNNKPTAVENDKDLALVTAREVVKENLFLNYNFQDSQILTLRVGIFDYDPITQRFQPSYPSSRPAGKSWSAVEVVVEANQPTFFARVMGIASM